MKRWLFRSIGVLLFVVILWRINLAEVRQALQLVGWQVWTYNLALLVLVTVFKSLRWQLLLRPLTNYSLARAALNFTAAGYLAMVTPGRIGDFMRAQFVKEETGVPASAALGSVVLDRIFDFG
ncbi:MAG TPA: lysylphosphatidylglycerol synthase transmembrane domain-containing protein, partial [bacterium]|nr:lysylphosphatidylglycerol synthase transmembrane domain-containing protein [bacterium]